MNSIFCSSRFPNLTSSRSVIVGVVILSMMLSNNSAGKSGETECHDVDRDNLGKGPVEIDCWEIEQLIVETGALGAQDLEVKFETHRV